MIVHFHPLMELPNRWRVVWRGLLTATLLLIACVNAAPAQQQGLTLKRSLPQAPQPQCPAFPAPTPASARDREQAREQIAAGNRAALLGDIATARAAFQRAAELDRASAVAAYRLARAHEEAGEREAAARSYCRLLAIAPGSADAEEARGRLSALVQTVPVAEQPAVRQFTAGIEHFDARRLQDAELAFGRAVQLAPRWADAYFNRGLISESRGNAALALRDYERYLQLSPGAADRGLVLQRVDTLRVVTSRRDPQTALVSGFVPGLGQAYTGRPAFGVLVFAGAAASTYVGLREQTELVTRTGRDPLGNEYEYQAEIRTRPDLGTGVGLAAAITAAAAVEAFMHARRTGRTRSASPAPGARPRASMQLIPTSDAVAVRVRIPLR